MPGPLNSFTRWRVRERQWGEQSFDRSCDMTVSSDGVRVTSQMKMADATTAPEES